MKISIRKTGVVSMVIKKEALPLNAPEARGKEFILKAYVDASFAGCKLTS